MANSTLLRLWVFWLRKHDTALLLVDRDNLESYIGVDRNGYAINGNIVTNYLLDLMLAKETFVPELCEMSKSFSSKMFTVLLASGVKLENLRFNRKHA